MFITGRCIYQVLRVLQYSLATIPKKCRGECWVCALPLARLVAGAGRSLVNSSIGLEHATPLFPICIPTIHLTHFQTCMPGRASRHAPVCVCQDSTQRARTTAGLVRREHTMAQWLSYCLRGSDFQTTSERGKRIITASPSQYSA